MINLTRLWTDSEQPADNLRYGTGSDAPANAADRKPVVVWNITRTCNLRCAHCYSDSGRALYDGELTLEQARELIDDLASCGVKHLLLSGGEPTLHPHFFEIVETAAKNGIHVTLSTNGTRLTQERAEQLKEIGLSYIGISLDGIGDAHDVFRGVPGAFALAVTGIRNSINAGNRTGLRVTLTRHNIRELKAFFRFIEEEKIPRVCFYHLVPAGRGGALELPTAVETRGAIDRIIEQVDRWSHEGVQREVLTVTQPADGAYLLWRFEREGSPQLLKARQLLVWNGGATHGSGTGIMNIDSQGNVHPDQFSPHRILGNVRERPFSEILELGRKQGAERLEKATRLIKGRCGSCRFFRACGGGFRSRAELLTGDPWGADPACYLDDEMIGLRD